MSNIHVNGKLEVGDLFNETDSETDQKVVEIRRHNDPPVVLCRSLKPAEESSETEQEYDLKYVAKCVRSRRQFIKCGYDDCDVYDIYHLTKKQLGYALDFAKQSTEGSKKELRDRLLLFRKITVVPSDVDTACDTEEESDENTLSDYVPVSSSSSSDSDSSSSSGNSDDEDVTIDNYLAKKTKKQKQPEPAGAASAAAVTVDGDPVRRSKRKNMFKFSSKPHVQEADADDADDEDDEDDDYRPSPKKKLKKRIRKRSPKANRLKTWETVTTMCCQRNKANRN